jgi:hypothetical protein
VLNSGLSVHRTTLLLKPLPDQAPVGPLNFDKNTVVFAMDPGAKDWALKPGQFMSEIVAALSKLILDKELFGL